MISFALSIELPTTMLAFCVSPGAKLPLRRHRGLCAGSPRHQTVCATTSLSDDERPLLLRAAAGEEVSRSPVWLLRQAGRYMASFRAYSERLAFRKRSEDAVIARELSLQPWRAFNTDAIILFSDILTPLPAIGIDFDVVPGRGPVLPDTVRTLARAREVAKKAGLFNPATALPFIEETLQALRSDVAGTDAALLGFVGAPFTLASYAVEGGSSRDVVHTKRLLYGDAEVGALRTLLDAVTDMVITYAVYQLDSGAHAVQLFESWAHHLSPAQYRRVALPWLKRAIQGIKRERPNATVMFFANGAAGKLAVLKEISAIVDVFHVDWGIEMHDARLALGDHLCLQGNVDPSVVRCGNKDAIRSAVRDSIVQARPGPHILNLGHGVVKDTPEESVRVFVDAAKEFSYDCVTRFQGETETVPLPTESAVVM